MFTVNPKGYCKFMSKHSSKYYNVKEEIYELLILAREGVLMRKNFGDYSYIDIIEDMDIPFLLIKGEFDNDINKNLETTIEAINNNYNASIIKLEQAGHFANLDKPKKFNRIVENVIKSVRRVHF